MKWFAIIVLVVLTKSEIIFCQNVGERISRMMFSKNTDGFDQVIKEVLMSFKDTMKKGDLALGLPVLDPYRIDESFDINNPNLKLKGEFHAEIHNLANYVIEEIHADMNLNVVVNLTLQDLSASGNYKLNGAYMDIVPIMGEGEHNLNVKSFNLALRPSFEAKDGYLKLIKSGLAFQEKNFTLKVDGLLEGADISKILAYFLRDAFSSLLSRNAQLARLIDTKLVSSFNGKHGKGENLYDIVETVKELATF